MRFSKATRKAVHSKFEGHCAYCGRDITLKQMQIDHAKPQASQRMIGRTLEGAPIYEDIHNIHNLMPSCRWCNNYKGGNGIEGLRLLIKNLSCNHRLIFASASKGRVLEGFGIVTIHPWDGLFYFERFQIIKSETHENIGEIPYQTEEGEIFQGSEAVHQHG